MIARARGGWLTLLLLANTWLLGVAPQTHAAARVGELVVHDGDVPRRLVGYGLVVGLGGTGDRSFGTRTTGTPTVRSIVNLLRRFDIEVPPDALRLRDAAAVLVTAEVSPYLRAGGRFEVQVSAIDDATSLQGGVLWMTPLIADPGQPPVATAQGPLLVTNTDRGTGYRVLRRDNAGRIAAGGLIETSQPAPVQGRTLHLREPGVGGASTIAAAVNARFGAGTARVQDPGSIVLQGPGDADSLSTFLAAVDTVEVTTTATSRVVIDARDGTVVSGGDARVESATVSHHGFTLAIGGAGATRAPAAGTAAPTGLVRLASQATVQDVAGGLHAAGARSDEIAAIFEALVAAGALRAEVVIR